MDNMVIKMETNQLEEPQAVWHYREVAKRCSCSVDYVRMVLIYKTRKSELIVSEYNRVVKESEDRARELKLKISSSTNEDR